MAEKEQMLILCQKRILKEGETRFHGNGLCYKKTWDKYMQMRTFLWDKTKWEKDKFLRHPIHIVSQFPQKMFQHWQ